MDTARLFYFIESGDLEALASSLPRELIDVPHPLNGRTPLVAACSITRHDVLTVFKGTITRLYMYDRQQSVARWLLDAGADPDLADDRGVTPFLVAIGSGQYDTAERLLKLGANPLATDRKGNGALHYHISPRAEENNEYAWIDSLVIMGCPVDDKNTRGMTPLMIAAQQGRAILCDTLLQAGANCLLSNNAGHRAIDLVPDWAEEALIVLHDHYLSLLGCPLTDCPFC